MVHVIQCKTPENTLFRAPILVEHVGGAKAGLQNFHIMHSRLASFHKSISKQNQVNTPTSISCASLQYTVYRITNHAKHH
ncbi:hypothetical protein Y032_0286g1386 [Ancylostoma ceylanicum]|uniref:Uncharacterized protein n=1 Tax=Ancylostoma ceylanicum TaxID=53326 RepID=A0A016S6U9_9BILA|nr:hypothetical protein Y032_0286g1386 [Ancylostoma ceylanicum]